MDFVQMEQSLKSLVVLWGILWSDIQLIAAAMRLMWTLVFRLIFKVLYKTAQGQSFSFPEEFIFVIKMCHKVSSQSCHVYMAPCRSSSRCSLCFLLSWRRKKCSVRERSLIMSMTGDQMCCYSLTLSFLNSSYSGLSVGSSSRQRGHELVCGL